MPLLDRAHWIFDMDGTLTVPQHDFAWLRSQLEIPVHRDILEELDSRPPDRAARDHAFVAQWEEGLARAAKPQPDAVALLDALAQRGATLGVLTRNTLTGARLALRATGLDRYFDPDAVVGRGCAPPKPHPGGVQHLLARWEATHDDAVVVGDWVHDIRAGAAAGAATVLVLRHGRQEWEREATVVVHRLDALLPQDPAEATATGSTASGTTS